jgi:predicted enzyme related to lactoylglutathione lyase
MPKKTEYEQGTPSWVDLQTTDQAAGKAFYASLLGWSYDDQPMPQGGTYSMALLNGETVAAIAPTPPGAPEGMPPMWNTYIAVDDIAATVEKVGPAGGQVLMPAMAVGDAGTMAFVADPTGAVVGLWQADQHIGATLVNEPGAPIWNELITDKPESALGRRTTSSRSGMPRSGAVWSLPWRASRTIGMCTSRCRTPMPLRHRSPLRVGRSPWSRSTSRRWGGPPC